MKWWKRWKEKHWDEKWVEGEVTSGLVFMGHTSTPPLRAKVRTIWKDIVAHRWQAVGLIVAIIIALLRPWK